MDLIDCWTPEETQMLTKLYVQDELELLPICRIMKKKCKVIINKLLELGLVKSKHQVRGTGTNSFEVSKVLPKKDTQTQTQSQSSQITSVLQFLNGVNLVVNEVSNIYQSYLKISQVNQTNPSNPSK